NIGLVINNRKKFPLYDFVGQEKAYYLVDTLNINRQDKVLIGKSVGHSIIIIDRSGSMYDDIHALKDTLIKLLTLDEYINYQLFIILISYS
ncbi:MAG: VWA domain-containing protein, partial [Scytonema sp. PMC 1069.18]|nr:VWA domain-containing protein [Scytonema sp. PMC 1069.18]